jgi:hypothetical protein
MSALRGCQQLTIRTEENHCMLVEFMGQIVHYLG